MDELIDKVLSIFIQEYCEGVTYSAPCKECSSLGETLSNTIREPELKLFQSPTLTFEVMSAYAFTLYRLEENLRGRFNPLSLSKFRNCGYNIEGIMKDPKYRGSLRKLDELLKFQDFYSQDDYAKVEHCHRMKHLLIIYAKHLENALRRKSQEFADLRKLLQKREASIKSLNEDIKKKIERNTELLTEQKEHKRILELRAIDLRKKDEKIHKQYEELNAVDEYHAIITKSRIKITDLTSSLEELKTAKSTSDAEISELKEKLAERDLKIKRLNMEINTPKKIGRGKINRNRFFHLTLPSGDLKTLLSSEKINLGNPSTFQFQMIKHTAELSTAKCCFPVNNDFNQKDFIFKHGIIARPWVNSKSKETRNPAGTQLKKRLVISKVEQIEQVVSDLERNLIILGLTPKSIKYHSKRYGIVIITFAIPDESFRKKVYQLKLEDMISEDLKAICSWWKPHPNRK